jgi:hypothetical protein
VVDGTDKAAGMRCASEAWGSHEFVYVRKAELCLVQCSVYCLASVHVVVSCEEVATQRPVAKSRYRMLRLTSTRTTRQLIHETWRTEFVRYAS